METKKKVVLYNKKGKIIQSFPFQIKNPEDPINIIMYLTDEYLVFLESEIIVSKQVRYYPQKQIIHLYPLSEPSKGNYWHLSRYDIKVNLLIYNIKNKKTKNKTNKNY